MKTRNPFFNSKPGLLQLSLYQAFSDQINQTNPVLGPIIKNGRFSSPVAQQNSLTKGIVSVTIMSLSESGKLTAHDMSLKGGDVGRTSFTYVRPQA